MEEIIEQLLKEEQNQKGIENFLRKNPLIGHLLRPYL